MTTALAGLAIVIALTLIVMALDRYREKHAHR